MEWSRATEEAARIAARWTAEGGPGGAIVLFNGTHIHSEAFGGLASLEPTGTHAADGEQSQPGAAIPKGLASWSACAPPMR